MFLSSSYLCDILIHVYRDDSWWVRHYSRRLNKLTITDAKGKGWITLEQVKAPSNLLLGGQRNVSVDDISVLVLEFYTFIYYESCILTTFKKLNVHMSGKELFDRLVALLLSCFWV